MTDTQPERQVVRKLNGRELEFGGLKFEVYFTGSFGATMRVFGQVDGDWKEMLRFDDFVDGPHYHAPADDHQINFDRAALGEPLAWYIAQIRDELPAWLTKSGFAEVIPTIDLKAVADGVGRLEEAMTDCLPEGFTRVDGVGLQRVGSGADTSP